MRSKALGGLGGRLGGVGVGWWKEELGNKEAHPSCHPESSSALHSFQSALNAKGLIDHQSLGLLQLLKEFVSCFYFHLLCFWGESCYVA